MTHNEVGVESLMRQAREGDNGALGRVLEMYRDYVSLLAQHQINRQLRGKVSPSDVVQDTFYRARRGFSDFRGQSERELLGWLRKILANQLAEVMRRYHTEMRDVTLEKRLHDDLESSAQGLVADLQANQLSPSEHAARREEVLLLSSALTHLPAEYREVLLLRHLEGLPFADVAQRMGRSVHSVKNLWTRAIVELRHTLGELS